MFSDVMIMKSQTVTTMSRQKLTKQFLPQQKGKIIFDKPHWYFFSAKAATNKR